MTRWTLQHVSLQDNFRTEQQISTSTSHFRWWNVSDDVCSIGRWSFWSWLEVNFYPLLMKMCTKKIFTFLFPVTVTF